MECFKTNNTENTYSKRRLDKEPMSRDTISIEKQDNFNMDKIIKRSSRNE